MKLKLLFFTWAFSLTATAYTEAIDTVSVSDIVKPTIDQVPFDELDSLSMTSYADRYVVVYKDGKCGVYDLIKKENVTRIEYDRLSMSFRKEIEGNYYTYFNVTDNEQEGVLGISEATNQYLTVMKPKEKMEMQVENLEDNVEEIQLDSATFMDMYMPAVEIDTIGRYTMVSEKGKLGVYDTWKKVNVPPVEFDVLYYAQRVVEGSNGARVSFIMQRKDDVGTIEIKEETNEYEVQIMAGALRLMH